MDKWTNLHAKVLIQLLKDHICQVTPRRLIQMMENSRDLAGYAGMENPPTFQTVRSLANSLAKKSEESREAIQKNNAHKSVDTQLTYQEGLDLPFDNAPIKFTA
jgi:hypothetical protein